MYSRIIAFGSSEIEWNNYIVVYRPPCVIWIPHSAYYLFDRKFVVRMKKISTFFHRILLKLCIFLINRLLTLAWLDGTKRSECKQRNHKGWLYFTLVYNTFQSDNVFVIELSENYSLAEKIVSISNRCINLKQRNASW